VPKPYGVEFVPLLHEIVARGARSEQDSKQGGIESNQPVDEQKSSYDDEFDLRLQREGLSNDILLLIGQLLRCYPKLRVHQFSFGLYQHYSIEAVDAIVAGLSLSASSLLFISLYTFGLDNSWQPQPIQGILHLCSLCTALVSTSTSTLKHLIVDVAPSSMVNALAQLIAASPNLETLEVDFRANKKNPSVFTADVLAPMLNSIANSSILNLQLRTPAKKVWEDPATPLVLSEEACAAISRALANHPTLQSLHLQVKTLKCDMFGAIFEAKDSKLQAFKFQTDEINTGGCLLDEQVAPLISALNNGLCSNLGNLTLANVSTHILVSLMQALGANRNQVHTLYMECDFRKYVRVIVDESAQAVGKMLAVNKSLVNIYFSEFQITSIGLEYVCAGLARNNTLRQLMFNDSEILIESTDGEQFGAHTKQREVDSNLQVLFAKALRENKGHALCTLGRSESDWSILAKHRVVIETLFANQV